MHKTQKIGIDSVDPMWDMMMFIAIVLNEYEINNFLESFKFKRDIA